MSGPAFDEGMGGLYWCDKHPQRRVVEPQCFRRCAECKAEAQAAYADLMIKRDKISGPQNYIELTPQGEILGGNDREKRHDKNYIDRNKEPT